MEKEEKKIPVKHYKYLGLLTALAITFKLLNDVTAGKLVQLGIFSVSAATIFFPITYILSDVFTEVYGYSKARSRVWLLLLCSVIAGIVYSIVAFLPPAIGFDANEAYVRVFSQVPRILVASWIAFFFGSIVNDFVLAKMKIWTRGKHLWTRTIGSTIFGESVDTVLFFTLAFYAIIPTSLLVTIIFSALFLKVAIEVVMTPVTYKVIAKLKKVEGEDYYDTNTNFNPLIIRN
ncbi:MAG: queuosine precursor transporter [Nanoarchaeota archaeon]|nr:queuosine precursor transporter [Nanoarchaeota archaeon]